MFLLLDYFLIKQHRFVNGILDNISRYKKMNERELIKKFLP